MVNAILPIKGNKLLLGSWMSALSGLGHAMALGIPWWYIYIIVSKEAPSIHWKIVFVDFFIVVLGCGKTMYITEDLPYAYWKTFSKEYFGK